MSTRALLFDEIVFRIGDSIFDDDFVVKWGRFIILNRSKQISTITILTDSSFCIDNSNVIYFFSLWTTPVHICKCIQVGHKFGVFFCISEIRNHQIQLHIKRLGAIYACIDQQIGYSSCFFDAISDKILYKWLKISLDSVFIQKNSNHLEIVVQNMTLVKHDCIKHSFFGGGTLIRKLIKYMFCFNNVTENFVFFVALNVILVPCMSSLLSHFTWFHACHLYMKILIISMEILIQSRFVKTSPCLWKLFFACQSEIERGKLSIYQSLERSGARRYILTKVDLYSRIVP